MYREMKYRNLKVNEIQPEGWYWKQLKTQAEGLCGNLDKVWPDVRDSKWIGGTAEGWERVPYWLDGFIPMAWLLRDAELQKRAVRYIDAILKQQKADGWICPCEMEERASYDVWAVFLICKVLVVYYECSQDDRIEQAVYDALKNLNRHLEGHTLFNWGAARWFEGLIPLGWLYDRRPEEWMRELAVKLRVQGIDYGILFENWPYAKTQGKDRWNYITHVVNLAMSLKADAVNAAFWGKQPGVFAENALDILMRDHGMPIGHFTGDECLSGKSPIQGTELCGVVEAMYSYEWILNVTGEDFWADRLEILAFNALPATISADMWTHQYDQMPNQIQCSVLKAEKNHFGTNGVDSHLFGLEPNYGCCTANFGQGWPKLAFSGILRTEKGLAMGAILPCSIQTVIREATVTCRVITEYPFEDGYRVEVEADRPLDAELSLRIPAGAEEIMVNGSRVEGNRYTVYGIREGKQEFDVRFRFRAELLPQDEYGWYVKRGPLVFSVPIEAEWKKLEYERNGVERKFPYCDYELYPKSDWNYAFAGGDFIYVKDEMGERAFDAAKPPVKLVTDMVPVEWKEEDGVAAVRPISDTPIGPKVSLDLVPYGCTDLRMTVMPVIK